MPRADSKSRPTATRRGNALRTKPGAYDASASPDAVGSRAPETASGASRRPRVATGNGHETREAGGGVKVGTKNGDGHETLPGWAGQLRLPMSWGLQTLMLMLHAGEEFQRAQLDCLHLALKRHEHAHQRLLSCEDTAEMASVQADLLRFDTANLTQLSQRCMDTGVHLNTDLARLVAQAMDGSRHHLMRSTFEGFQSGLRTGFRPLDEIFSAPILRELMMPKTAMAQTASAQAATAQAAQ
ncbi:MAG: hypothetical protein EBQ88_07115 [Betaproteobacteria bacterium]|nr:hypothetical protein [Betaproteobacteria bacterium]